MFSTGQLRRILDVSERRLDALCRQGRINVPLFAGRRVWSADLALRAARLLGRDTPEVRNRLLASTDEVSHGR